MESGKTWSNMRIKRIKDEKKARLLVIGDIKMDVLSVQEEREKKNW